MYVVDTNIVVYLLLQGDRTVAARSLFEQDADWRTDSFLLVEFCNVLATMIRVRSLAPSRARETLAQAEKLFGSRWYAAAHSDALTLAEQCRISVYDARFLVVAKMHGARLVTEDVKLRRAVPGLTQSLFEALEKR